MKSMVLASLTLGALLATPGFAQTVYPSLTAEGNVGATRTGDVQNDQAVITTGSDGSRIATIQNEAQTLKPDGWTLTTFLQGTASTNYGSIAGGISALAEDKPEQITTPLGSTIFNRTSSEVRGFLNLGFHDSAVVTSATLPAGTAVNLTITLALEAIGVGSSSPTALDAASAPYGMNAIGHFQFAGSNWRDFFHGVTTFTYATQVGATVHFSGELDLTAEAFAGWDIAVGLFYTKTEASIDANHTANFYIDTPAGVTLLTASGHNYASDAGDPPGNTPPTITAIADQTLPADGSTGPLAFTIGDAETAAANLSVVAETSNTGLVPPAGLVVAGSGAARTLTVAPAAGQTGSALITVTVSDGAATATSSFTLTVAPAGRLVNLSTRALVQSGDNILIPGFVIAGSSNKRLLIRTVGPTLADPPIGFSGTILPNPQMVLKRWNPALPAGGAFEDVVTNDDWGSNTNAADIASTSAQLFAFELKRAEESALLLDLSPGQYTVFAQDKSGGSGVAIVELYDADDSAGDSRLINISNRGFCGVGDEVMIPGFVIADGPRTVLVRVVAPTLAQAPFNLAGTMGDPKLVLARMANGVVAQEWHQDDWGDEPDATHTAEVAAEVFAFPLNPDSGDAAFVKTLAPGAYTVIGSAANGTDTGIVLVEIYVVP